MGLWCNFLYINSYVRDSKIYKKPVEKVLTETKSYRYTLGNEKEVTIRELLERNVEGTTI